MKPVNFYLLVSVLFLASCGPSPLQPPPATIIPFNPTYTPLPTPTPPFPNSTETPIPIVTGNSPATPFHLPLRNLWLRSWQVAILFKARHRMESYTGILSISLNPAISNSSTRRAEYRLAWDTGATGGGIFDQGCNREPFLAAGFGGSACSAVFYYAFPYMQGNTSTLLSTAPGSNLILLVSAPRSPLHRSTPLP